MTNLDITKLKVKDFLEYEQACADAYATAGMIRRAQTRDDEDSLQNQILTSLLTPDQVAWAKKNYYMPMSPPIHAY